MISQRLNRFILFHELSFTHTSYFIYLQLNVTSLFLCALQDNNVHQRHTQKSSGNTFINVLTFLQLVKQQMGSHPAGEILTGK